VRRHRSNAPETIREYAWDGILRARRNDGTGSKAFMVFGHNTNLKLGSVTLHIQTEDRGEAHAVIDTTVYYRGRVLHRRTNGYADLLPLDADREEALRLRLDDQHHTVIEEIRSGALQLAIPQEAPVAQAASAAVPAEPKNFYLELTNAKSWLSGKRAKLLVLVREQDGPLVSGAQVKVEFEGSEGGVEHHGQTDAQGQVLLEFDLPRITSPEAAMLISAERQDGKGHLRFALRAKPRMVTS